MNNLTLTSLLSLFFILFICPIGKCQSSNTETECDDIFLNINVDPLYDVLSCDVSSITLAASGNSSNGSYSISWLDQVGQSVITVSETGIYTAIITDSNSGCTATATSQIDTINNTPSLNLGPDQTISCLNTSAFINPEVGNSTGALNFNWIGLPIPCDTCDIYDPSELNQEISIPGEYILEIHEILGGCTVYDSILISEVFDTINTSFSVTLCPGTCFQYGATEICEGGSYQLFFESGIACDTLVNIQIDFINIDATIEIPDTLTCLNPQVSLNGSNSLIPPDAIYNWTTFDGHFAASTNSLTPLVDAPGTYYLHISTTTDCQTIDSTVVISMQNRPEADAGEDTQLDCINLIANINAAIDTSLTAYELRWNGPNGFESDEAEVTVDTIGIYTLKIKNLSNGCDTEDDVFVGAPEEVNITLDTKTACWNDAKGQIDISILDGGFPPYSFALNNLDHQTDSSFQQLASGTHTLQWKDAFGCGGQTDVYIPEVPPLETELIETYHICGDSYTTINAAVKLKPFQNPISYIWNTGSTLPLMRTNTAGQNWVEISNKCETIHQDIEIINDLDLTKQKIYVPSAFSPNNDLANDLFIPYINQELIHYQIHIFDRRGSLMFSTEDRTEGWDGTLKGRNAPPAVYAWQIEYIMPLCGGRHHEVISGDVTLVR